MDHTVPSDGLPDDLRSIRLDDGRRLQPLRLDAMFDRASNWRKSSQAGPSARAPSPPRKSRVYPLPKAMEAGVETSPLAGLFEYPELVPQVLKWFDRPAELATIARVNQEFLGIARKQMYASIWIRPWEAQCHDKLDLLFRTLKDQPELCKLVKTLDVRFFPLAIRDTQRYELDEQVQSAVEHMANLEHLVWTRDKSLNPPLVERMVSLKRLRTLEISGHSHRYYTPTLLGKSTSLDDLRVMMPDSDFGASLVKVVRDLDSRTVGGLRGLAIVARSSPLVDDRMLKEMALHLRTLRRLTLWGCTRVTRSGVFDILRQSEDLEELSLDATTHNDLRDLSGSPSLPSLHTLSLSFASPHRTPQHPHLTVADLPVLPREIPCLTSLFLTLSGDRAFLPPGGLDHLSQQVELANLKRLSILNLFIGTTNLESLLSQSSELEELYISVNGRNTVLECKALRGSVLKILHVNAPERWGPDIDDMTDLARVMPALEQIGSGNRVYEINRRYEGDEHVVELCRWSKTYTPGYFQIWRG